MDLEDLKNLARKAGEISLKYFRKLKDKDIKNKSESWHDPVTIADLKISEMLKEELKAFPGVALLSEESVHDFSYKKGQPILVVDELDGTNNYSNGSTDFCHMFCIMKYDGKDYEPETAVIYKPIGNIMYWAKRGEGAYKDGKRLKTGGGKDHFFGVAGHIDDKGFLRKYDYLIKKHKSMKNRATIKVRGSGGLMAMTIAEGKCKVCNLMYTGNWDQAAPVLIVREAGGEAFLLSEPDDIRRPRPWKIELDEPGKYLPTIFTDASFDIADFYKDVDI